MRPWRRRDAFENQPKSGEQVNWLIPLCLQWDRGQRQPTLGTVPSPWSPSTAPAQDRGSTVAQPDRRQSGSIPARASASASASSHRVPRSCIPAVRRSQARVQKHRSASHSTRDGRQAVVVPQRSGKISNGRPGHGRSEGAGDLFIREIPSNPPSARAATPCRTRTTARGERLSHRAARLRGEPDLFAAPFRAGPPVRPACQPVAFGHGQPSQPWGTDPAAGADSGSATGRGCSDPMIAASAKTPLAALATDVSSVSLTITGRPCSAGFVSPD